jgi:hypothetical protein
MTLTRLFLPLYFLGCPRNFLVLLWQQFSPVMNSFQPEDMQHPGDIIITPEVLQSSINTIIFVLVWIGIQLVVMGYQSYFGPRGCIPKSWFPRGYDYHRPIPRAVILGQRSSSSSSTSSSARTNTSRRPLTLYERFRRRLRWYWRYLMGRSSSYHNGIRYSTVSTTENFLSASTPGEEDEEEEEDSTVPDSDDGIREYGDIETGSYLPSFLSSSSSSSSATTTAQQDGKETTEAGDDGQPPSEEGHGLDCVICYNQIYLNLRTPYMVSLFNDGFVLDLHVYNMSCFYR